MFRDKLNAEKVARRYIVKFNLPPCKTRVKFGYSTHYDYEIDERGRVILINGGAASWGEVRQTALIISP